ncbi:MAG TPA: DUF5110 domain-containing protein [Ktedonobacterales bacterium]|nr:DUF5110 domain-containing protein [Ktedonobacterales bacterium]
MGPVTQNVEERAEDPVTLAVYLGQVDGAQAEGTLYEDDGATPAYREGAWRLTRFTAERKGETVTVSAEAPEGSYEGGAHEWVVELHLPYAGGVKEQRPAVRAARLGERDLAGIEVAAWRPASERRSGSAARYETVARIAVGHVSAPFMVEVTLG